MFHPVATPARCGGQVMQGSVFAMHYPLKEDFDRLPMLWRVGYNPTCMQYLRPAKLPRIRINEPAPAVECI